MKIFLLTLLGVALLNNVLVAQVNSGVFDQLQENVWYLPTADGSARLYVTSIGTGDTIVTLHGGPGNDFNYLVDAVKGNSQNNTFILFDQRGSLLSPVTDSLIPLLTLDAIVEDLETLRQSLKQDKMLLFGHSFGSLAVMSYYLKYPEHVKGIILSATMPPYINDDKPFKEILKEIHKRCQDLRRRPEIAAELTKAGLVNDSLLSARQRSDKFKIMGLASFNMINIADWKKFKGGGIYYNPLVDNAIGETIPSTYDIRPALDIYPVPITVIQGDKDYIDPSAQYWTTIFTNYDFVELIAVKNASHYIWLDDKLKFDTSMRYAIDRVNERSSSLYRQNSLVWEFATRGRVYSSPVVDDNTLYIGSNDSCLYALDKFNGTQKWKFMTDGQIKSRPLLFNNSVIFNSTDGLVYSVNKKDGQLQWQFKTNGEKKQDMWDYYLSSPAFSNGNLVVGSGDGNIYALEPDSGRLLWKFKTEGIVHSTPVIHNNKVYVGSFDGCFYALNTQNGALVWKFTTGDDYYPKGAIQKGATIHKNAVIFGSRNSSLYALEAETGSVLWNMKEKVSWIIAKPLIVGETVYFGTSDSHRFCGLNVGNGYEEYTYPLNMRVYSDAILFESDIYFGCFNGKLYRLDKSKRKVESIFQTHGSKKNYNEIYDEKDEFRTDFELYGKDLTSSENKILNLGSILSTPIIDSGIIYFGDANGMVYAYKLKADS